jgi:5'-nucleotidase
MMRLYAFCSSFLPILCRQAPVSVGRVRVEHALQADHIHVKRLNEVTTKLKRMSQDGPERFQIMSDFDRTLSPYLVNGKHCCSTHGVPQASSILSQEFSDKTLTLHKKYYPIEVSSVLSHEEKTQSMIEWWTLAHSLMVEYGLKQEHLEPMVRDANIDLRPGCSLLFDTANRYGVPVLIFSAGLGGVIAEVIRQKAILYPCIRILANEMEFSEKGDLQGVREPLVHTFNKAKIAVHHKAVFEEVKDRSNILLLGDSTGDPHMADAFEEEHSLNIVKIGFLNCREEELLARYQELYDIVLTGDSSLDVVNTLLVYILDQQAHLE